MGGVSTECMQGEGDDRGCRAHRLVVGKTTMMLATAGAGVSLSMLVIKVLLHFSRTV